MGQWILFENAGSIQRQPTLWNNDDQSRLMFRRQPVCSQLETTRSGLVAAMETYYEAQESHAGRQQP